MTARLTTLDVVFFWQIVDLDAALEIFIEGRVGERHISLLHLLPQLLTRRTYLTCELLLLGSRHVL